MLNSCKRHPSANLVGPSLRCAGCLAEEQIDELRFGPDLDYMIAYEVFPIDRDDSGRLVRPPSKRISEVELHDYSSNMEWAWYVVSHLKDNLSAFLRIIDAADAGYTVSFHLFPEGIKFESRDLMAELAICRASLKLARHFFPPMR